MKYTFQTNDDYEARRILKADDMAIALWDIQFNLRKRCEHQIEGIGADEFLDKIFEELNDILEENDINADKLVE
jgi:hypothetical protein